MQAPITRLITAEQAAELLAISKARAYQLARMNAVPGVVRLGRQVRFNRQALEAFIGGGSVEAASLTA